MDQRITDLYDEYTHAPLARRVFIKRLTALAGSSAGAMAALPLLESNYAFAATVPPDDARIDAGIAAYEAALKAAGVSYTKYVYEGTQHAFHNDTAGARYDKEAAELAWRRTVEFLNATLES